MITRPTMGLAQAVQQPFCVVVTPCSVMWLAREPSIESSWFAGGGVGEGVGSFGVGMGVDSFRGDAEDGTGAGGEGLLVGFCGRA